MKNEKLEKLIKNREEFKKLNNGSQEVVIGYERKNDKYSNYTTDYIIIKEIWSDDMQDALNFMKEVGIAKFIFTDTSTEACKSIIKFLENGCKLSPIVYEIAELYGGQLKENLKGNLVEL